MAGFKGKPPGSGSGEMSKRTEALRPNIEMTPAQSAKARKMRRQGHEPGQIAQALGVAFEDVEKALVQMRSPRPETTRGTLNVTLAARSFVLSETRGDEPVWQSFDRILDELLVLRSREASLAARLDASGARRAGEGPWVAVERILSEMARSGARDGAAGASSPRRRADRQPQPPEVALQMGLFGTG